MSNSHVTFSRQGACQDSHRQGDFSPEVMYLVFERVREKMSDVLWPTPPPPFSSPNRQRHFPAWYSLLQPFSSRPPNSHTALQQTGFTLHLVPGRDELNIPGDTLWCSNPMDQLLLSLRSKMQKKLIDDFTVRVGWGFYPAALDLQFVCVRVCVLVFVCTAVFGSLVQEIPPSPWAAGFLRKAGGLHLGCRCTGVNTMCVCWIKVTRGLELCCLDPNGACRLRKKSGKTDQDCSWIWKA